MPTWPLSTSQSRTSKSTSPFFWGIGRDSGWTKTFSFFTTHQPIARPNMVEFRVRICIQCSRGHLTHVHWRWVHDTFIITFWYLAWIPRKRGKSIKFGWNSENVVCWSQNNTLSSAKVDNEVIVCQLSTLKWSNHVLLLSDIYQDRLTLSYNSNKERLLQGDSSFLSSYCTLLSFKKPGITILIFLILSNSFGFR